MVHYTKISVVNATHSTSALFICRRAPFRMLIPGMREKLYAERRADAAPAHPHRAPPFPLSAARLHKNIRAQGPPEEACENSRAAAGSASSFPAAPAPPSALWRSSVWTLWRRRFVPGAGGIFLGE